MFNKILVPLDGTEMAEAALPYAEELSGMMGSDVVLLHVCGPEQKTSQSMLLHYLSHTAEDVASAANQLYIETTGEQPAKPVEASWEVIRGETAHEIVNYAAEEKAELIIIYSPAGTANNHPPGDTAMSVLKHSPTPVMLVRKAVAAADLFAGWGRGGIMVTLDGTERSETLIPFAETLTGRRIDTRIILVNIFKKPHINSDYPESAENLPWPEHVKRMQAFFRQKAEEYLDGVRKTIDSSNEIDAVVGMGDPADEIAAFSKKLKPDVILIAPHGYSEISRLEYGNVAEKVIREVDTPVLIVGPEVKAPKMKQSTGGG